MINVNKNDKKTRKVNEGVTFTSDYQPSSEAKSEGWKKWRAKRLLTQEIIKKMIGEDGTPTATFKGYIDALIENAMQGNSKAIDTINNGLEDQIIKQEITLPKLGKDLEDEIYVD